MTIEPIPTRRRPGPRPQIRVHLGTRISPKIMERIDALVEQRRENVTATSKNAIVEELLALGLDAYEQMQSNLVKGM